jgi:hypothetical protein
MEDAGWDPLDETQGLVEDLVRLTEAPLNDYTRLRLGLLLYSHITEIDAIYVMLVNLIEITAGARYTMDPFQDLYGAQSRPRYQQVPPSATRVVDRVVERAEERGYPQIAELLQSFFNNDVRNAFFHSDYVLYRDEFRSREGTFLVDDGRWSSLKLDVIADLINRSIHFYGSFMAVYSEHRASYTEDKEIEGRLGPNDSTIPVTLMASPERGLYGFRSP